MKKNSKLLLAVGLTMSLGLAACSNDDKGEGTKTKTEQTSTDKYEGEKASEVVSYTLPSKVLKKIENKETFAFIIGNAKCTACNDFKENGLKEFASKENNKLMFVETFNLEKDKDEAAALVEIVDKHLQSKFEATPTTYFIVDGVLKDNIVGSITYNELKENYANYIK